MIVDIEQLQSDITTRLDSEPLLALIPVKSLRKLVITSELDANLITTTPKTNGTKIGAGIVVGMPTIEVPEPNIPGPMLKAMIPIRVLENPTVNQDAANGTLMTAEEIAITVLQNLHQMGFYGWETIYGARRGVVPHTAEDTAGFVAYDVIFEAALPLSDVFQVNLPTLNVTEPAQVWQVTLTDTTGGAAIYYTVDGSCPGSANGAAVLYAGVFAIPKIPGQTVTFRWCAYKAGMRGSDVGQAVLTP